MKTTVQQESPIRKQIEVIVDAATIKHHVDDAYKEIGKKAKLKGFRPGKVPRHILEKHYAQDALNQAIHSLVDATYPEALQKEGLEPLSYPEIDILRFDPAQELAYRARFDVKPVLEQVKGYKGLQLKKMDVKVSDEELQARLVAYQNQQAKLLPIETPRSPKDGDVVTFDYVALRDGQAFEGNEVNGYQAELGTGVLLKEFERAMETMALGEKKQIDVTLPDDFADKNFAGKKMQYTVTLKEMKQKQVPDINNDLAKDLGFDDEKSWRDAVRQELQQAKEQEARAQLHREVVTALIAANEFMLPDSMIESELASMYEQLRQNLTQQGQTPEALGLTPEQFREKNRDEAIVRLKGLILFEAIWKAEGLTVSDEDRSQKIAAVSQMLRQPETAVRKFYEEDPGRLTHLDVLILQDKTLDFIMGQAKN